MAQLTARINKDYWGYSGWFLINELRKDDDTEIVVCKKGNINVEFELSPDVTIHDKTGEFNNRYSCKDIFVEQVPCRFRIRDGIVKNIQCLLGEQS